MKYPTTTLLQANSSVECVTKCSYLYEYVYLKEILPIWKRWENNFHSQNQVLVQCVRIKRAEKNFHQNFLSFPYIFSSACTSFNVALLRPSVSIFPRWQTRTKIYTHTRAKKYGENESLICWISSFSFSSKKSVLFSRGFYSFLQVLHTCI